MLNRLTKLYRNIRKHICTHIVKRACATYGKHLVVTNVSFVSPQTYLGDHVNMNGLSVSGIGEVHIGNYFHSGAGCQIITSNHNYDYGTAIPYDFTNIPKKVVIEDCVWLGSRVLILPGVTIHEGAIIQAGSVVATDIPYCGIAGGAPAKVFKYRNIEHYERLKNENKFH